MQAHILSLHAPLVHGWGPMSNYLYFWKKLHEYCISKLRECSIKHHKSKKHSHPWPGGWIKIVCFLLKVITFHIIKLKRMNRTPWKHISCPYTHIRLQGWSQKFITFLKVVMVHIELMGMKHRLPCKHTFCPYTHPRSLGRGHMVKTFFLKWA